MTVQVKWHFWENVLKKIATLHRLRHIHETGSDKKGG